jgi:acyl-CoA-binding protein
MPSTGRRSHTNYASQLYGLFKYLTAAHSPNIARPGLLDFAGRAKWDVWLDAAKKYEEREAEAEVRYLDIARGLGWVEGVQPELAVATRTMTTNTMSPPHQLVGLDSDDGEDEGVGGGGGEDGIWDPPDYQEENAGVGTIISSVAQSKVEVTDEQPLHSLSVQGDADALREYLAEHPNTDVNNPDEFVSVLDL